jgi:hypothetical protein
MEDEIFCLEGYVEVQKAFADALRERDWQALQACMNRLEEITSRLAEVEKTRAAAETVLREGCGCCEAGFYHLALYVPEPERTALTDNYRKLKLSAMRARFENKSAGEYAKGSSELLGSVLEELFPEKKGRIYGRSGRPVMAGHDALVLNTGV